jgi:Flp pilus assembly protein TadG
MAIVKLLGPMWKFLEVILTRLLRRFGADSRGNTALMFACCLPVLLATCGLAIDLGTMTMKRATLQSAADEAAMAGAKQLALASATDTVISAAVTGFLQNQLTGDDAGATNIATIDHTAGTVKVQVTEDWTPFFAHFLSATVTPIITSATAALQGENRLCILSLNPIESQAFRMMNSAQVHAAGCGVFSNSTDAQGMALQQSSSITAAVICSAGGVAANRAQTSVIPQTDCAPLADPLASRAAPSFAGCTQTNLVINAGIVSLAPGVYCGGLKVTGSATVTFNPGTYVIKDGPLNITSTATATGTNVGFYLTGTNALINFTSSATVNLSGAESGPMAGLLFFADRAEPDGSTHVINATNVQNLTGTIYLPTGDLRVDPNATVANNSAYTAIIAKRIRVIQGSNLVMNTNYGATNVPVPDGVRTSGTVILTN